MTLTRLSWRYTLHYLRLDLPVALALMLILATSTALVSGGVLLAERHQATVDRLFATALPPHFVQLHTGDYDLDVLKAFAAERAEIATWQVSQSAGFDGADLTVSHAGTPHTSDLSTSLIDHLFVSQHEDFDFLLDPSHTIPQPDPGSVYVPVAMAADYEISSGDQLLVATPDGELMLTVQGTVVDAQMGSSMASATRFLVHPSDHAILLAAGNAATETMISYRLHDTASVPDFQRAYTSHPATPQQGQAVTEVMIRLVTVISEGLVAALSMLTGIFLAFIGLVNIRFVVRSTIAQDHREIGTLRAIGLPRRTITGLYLPRFVLITSSATALGTAAALLLGSGLLDLTGASWQTALWPVLAAALLWAGVLTGCAGLLWGALRAPLAHMLGPQPVRPRRRRPRRPVFAGVTGWRVNVRYTVATLRQDWRHWLALPIVFGLGTILCVFPAALSTTIQHPHFVQYLGSPAVDLRLDLNATPRTAQRVTEELTHDPRVASVVAYAQQRIPAVAGTASTVLDAQVGDFSDTNLAFVTGGPPRNGQIALSVLNAQLLDLETGEMLQVGPDRDPVEVSGVYQDVTAGGYTAKLAGQPDGSATRWVLLAEVAPGIDPVKLAADYRAEHLTALPMTAYVAQTLSYVTQGLQLATWISCVTTLAILLLMTLLFCRLARAREQSRTTTLAILGFPTGQVGVDQLLRTVLPAVLGIILGVVTALVAGPWLTSAWFTLSGVGIVDFRFLPAGWLVYVLLPMLLVCAAFIGSWLARGTITTKKNSRSTL